MGLVDGDPELGDLVGERAVLAEGDGFVDRLRERLGDDGDVAAGIERGHLEGAVDDLRGAVGEGVGADRGIGAALAAAQRPGRDDDGAGDALGGVVGGRLGRLRTGGALAEDHRNLAVGLELGDLGFAVLRRAALALVIALHRQRRALPDLGRVDRGKRGRWRIRGAEDAKENGADDQAAGHAGDAGGDQPAVVLRLLVIVERVELIGIEVFDMDRTAHSREARRLAADRNAAGSSAQPRVPSADMLRQALGMGGTQRRGSIRQTQAHEKSNS